MTAGPIEAVDLRALSGLAPELAAVFVSVASDIALVIDPAGVIRQVALGSAPFAAPADGWVGRRWTETVTGETRRKVELLLEEVGHAGVSRRREVNHPSPGGDDIPVAYAAVRLGDGGPVLAVGRDLRAIAAIQQRFVEAQQEMERDYWQLRQAESRSQQLLQVASDAVLVVDAQTLLIVEANGAAAELLAGQAAPGRPIAAGIDATSRAAVEELMATARGTGRALEMRARIAHGARIVPIDLSVVPFRASASPQRSLLLLVRARRAETMGRRDDRDIAPAREARAAVITDANGRILMADRAFAAWCAVGTDALRALDLEQALGDGGGCLAGSLDAVRRRGMGPPAVMTAITRSGATFEVEVAAALLAEGDQENVGFTFRRLTDRATAQRGDGRAGPLAAALQQLAAQLGELPLDELLPRAAELVERHLIETAMARAVGEASLAAGILGVSGDSLAARLQRLGIADDAGHDREADTSSPR